jgi:uroporphyrinogen-III synthase
MGPGTARELRGAGLAPDLIARESRAEGLARELAPRLAPGDRVLLVRPEVARPVLEDELRRAGARVEAVAFYRNVPAAEVPSIAADVAAGAYDALVFTSPSTVERLIEGSGAASGEVLRAMARTRLVAIGSVTASAVKRLGLPAPVVAEKPSDDALVAAVRRALGG